MSSLALSAGAPALPRSRMAAALLSLLAPGLGHLYIGQRRRALVLMSFEIVICVLGLVAAVSLPREIKPVTIFVVAMWALTLLYYLCAIIDAVRLARRADAAPPVRWYVLLAAGLAFWVTTTAFEAMMPKVQVSAYWKCEGSLWHPENCVRVR